jgi:hypothetical protein
LVERGTKNYSEPTQQKANRKVGHEPAEVRVEVTPTLHDHLRYLGRVDGVSVPAVIRQMIENGIRHRKATDPEFRNYTKGRL